jgi:drug/metabolite transporter (DMT)-like permease
MSNEEKKEEIKNEIQIEINNQEKKKRIKSILLNSILVFIICLVCTFSYSLYQDYEYYSVYSKEELAEFFSMKDTVLWELKQALSWNIMQMIIYVPILAILEKRKIGIWKKLFITLALVGIISFLYIMSNLTITF